MKKYLMMIAAALLIAAAPVYYAITTAHAQENEEAALEPEAGTPLEITIDCTKAALNGEALPAECEPAPLPVE